MKFTLSHLRDTLDHARLRSPDIIFWFEHTAFPLLVTRGYPNDYLHWRWDQLKERRLTGITAGFAAKGDGLMSGYNPVCFNPPLTNTVREIRVVRFIPDSGEASLETIKESDASLDTMTLSCKIKSTAIVAALGNANEKERELYVEDLFNLQITMHSRKIEF